MSAEKRGASPNKTSFSHRANSGFKWDGMAPDIEPQDLPPNRPFMLKNVRLESGGIAARGGLETIIDLGQATSGFNISGLNDFQTGTKRQLVVVSAGCPGFSASAGFFIGTYDTEQNPSFQRMTYYPTAVAPGVIATFGDDLYFCVDTKLMKLQAITPPFGTESLNVSGANQELEVWTIPTGYSSITALIEFNGDLYIGLQGTVSANSAVYKYDGVTFTKEIGSINPITGFALYRELLIAGHDGTSNLIRTRTTAGVWATVAPGSGTVRIVQNNCASYKDVLYIPNASTSIYSFNGTTLTEIPFGTTGISATGVCKAVEIAYGYLFFAWYDAAKVAVGRFDGTTWVGIHKNLTTQFTIPANQQTGAIRFYRGSLAVTIGVTGVFQVPQILFSPREDTSGTWTSESISTSVVVSILHMAVY